MLCPTTGDPYPELDLVVVNRFDMTQGHTSVAFRSNVLVEGGEVASEVGVGWVPFPTRHRFESSDPVVRHSLVAVVRPTLEEPVSHVFLWSS
jgi:hypothetical protein